VARESVVTYSVSDPSRQRVLRQRGYSIAEVLTVIAIGAAISGIAVPNFVSLSARYQLSSAAQQLAFDVGRARMKAVGENVYCRVRFAAGESGSTYWLERSNDGTTYSLDGVTAQLPRQVSFSGLPDVIPSYNRLGVGTGTSVIQLVNAKGQTKTVSINLLGKVTIQ
jgi:prepilin-type N-terminal cleavage/methylation domain-containing protein